jgi:hypothetical protein
LPPPKWACIVSFPAHFHLGRSGRLGEAANLGHTVLSSSSAF